MSTITYDPNHIWRDGPATAPHHPIKHEIRAYHSQVQQILMGLIAEAGDFDLPNLMIRYTVTGGTEDAIVAEPNLPVPGPGMALLSIQVTQDNTGPVTINGKPWLTNVGNEFVAGGIKAGGIYLFLDNGDHFRSITDQDVSALVAAAEASANRAEGFAAMLSADKLKFKTVQLLLSDEIMSYSDEPGKVQVGPGDITEAGGFRFVVAASGASVWSVENANGVKLIAIPGLDGFVTSSQFGGDVVKAALHFPNVRVDEHTQVTQPIQMQPNGHLLISEGVIIDAMAQVGGATILCEGSMEQIANLGGDIAEGDRTVTLGAGHGLAVGDTFIVYDPSVGSFAGTADTEDHAGEWFRIVRLSGNVAVVHNPAWDSYGAGDVEVYKVNLARPTIENRGIIFSAASRAIETHLCEPVIHTGIIDQVGTSAVYARRCFCPIIHVTRIHNAGIGGNTDYGIVIGNSQHARTYVSGSIYGDRHAVAHGGDAQPGAVPTRDSLVFGGTLSNNPARNVHCADFHPNVDGCAFIKSVINGGAILAGRNNGYEGCDISNLSTGVVVNFGTVAGGVLYVRGGSLFSDINPASGSRALLSCNVEIEAGARFPTKVEVSGGVKVKGRNFSAGTRLLRIQNQDAVKPIDISLTDIEFDVDNFGALFYTLDQSPGGTIPLRYVEIDRITGLPAPVRLHQDDAGNYDIAQYRLPSCGGRQNFSSGTGGSVSLGFNQFLYRYPKPPRVFIASTPNLIGGVTPIDRVREVSDTQFRATIYASSGNFSGGDGELMWEASYRDF